MATFNCSGPATFSGQDGFGLKFGTIKEHATSLTKSLGANPSSYPIYLGMATPLAQDHTLQKQAPPGNRETACFQDNKMEHISDV